MKGAWRLAAILVVLPPRMVTAQERTVEARGFTIIGGSAISVLVEDAPRLAAWYADAFGLRPVKHLEADDAAYDIHILSGGGLVVELIRLATAAPRPPDRSLGLFKAGVFVDDIDAAYAWMSTRASTVDAAPFTDAALQVRSFLLRDPEGNRLQFFARCTGPCPP